MSELLTWTNCRRKLADLKEWDRNPATIDKAEAERLLQSLDEFGQVQAIAIDPNNVIIDGHQRRAVWSMSAKYGPSFSVDCRRSSRDLTEQEREKLAIFLRSGAVGHYNWDELANWNVSDLREWGLDDKQLKAWKSDVSALSAMLESDKTNTDAEPEIDRAAELLEKWGVQTGDLWQIGEHRLLCGDSTKREDVERVLGGERADMVFTDPPYNVASKSRNYAADKSKAMKDLSDSEWDKDFDISAVFPILEIIMAKDCAVYLCTSHWLVQKVWEWMWSWSDFCFYCVWCKPNPMPSLSKRHWTWATELIPYAVRGKHVSNFPQDGHALNWWNIAKDKDTKHPTEKVVGVPERAIEFSSNHGAIIFDGFAGSGTTMVACQNLGRKCRAIEISPAYCAVILERMSQAFPDLKIE